MSNDQLSSLRKELVSVLINGLEYVPCRAIASGKKAALIKGWDKKALTKEEILDYDNPAFVMAGLPLLDLLDFDSDNISEDELDGCLRKKFGATDRNIRDFKKRGYKTKSNKNEHSAHNYLFKIPEGYSIKRNLRPYKTEQGQLEFRSGRNKYRIISGFHPKGCRYTNDGILSELHLLPKFLWEHFLIKDADSVSKQTTKNSKKNSGKNSKSKPIEVIDNREEYYKQEQLKKAEKYRQAKYKKRDKLNEFEIEALKYEFSQLLKTAPPIEDRNEWRDITFALRERALEIDIDDEWAFDLWVEWSRRASNACSSLAEYEYEWNVFEPNGTITGASFHKYFHQKQYDLGLWDLTKEEKAAKAEYQKQQLIDKLALPDDIPENVRQLIELFIQQASIDNSVLSTYRDSIDFASMIRVSTKDSKPFLNLSTGVFYSKGALADALGITVQTFSKTYMPYIICVTDTRNAPGKTLLFEENGYIYYNTYVSRRNYADRKIDRCAAMYFEIMFRYLKIEDIIHFMNCYAFKLKHPERKIMHSLLLESANTGFGKSTLVRVFADYFGDKMGITKSASDMLGKNNEFLEGCIILNIDESDLDSVRQKKYFESKMKNLIAPANPVISLKQKYEDDRQVPNYFFMSLTCNGKNAFYIPPNDRRYKCIAFNDKEPKFSNKFYSEFNKLYSTITPEYYDREVLGGVVNEQDTTFDGVKSIIGAFQRWDYEKPYESFVRLLEELKGLTKNLPKNSTLDPESEMFDEFMPGAPIDNSDNDFTYLSSYQEDVLDYLNGRVYIFDEEICNMFHGKQGLSRGLPQDIDTEDKRKHMMEHLGFQKYTIVVWRKELNKSDRVKVYSKIDCGRTEKARCKDPEIRQARKENISLISEDYSRIFDN